jgi:hypothetical protein
MTAPDLDRLIDVAARQLVGREPSRALTDSVMARVFATPSWSRFSDFRVWASAVALIAIIAVVLVLKTSSVPIQRPQNSASATSQRDQSSIAAPDRTAAVRIASRPAPKDVDDRSRRLTGDDNVAITSAPDDPIEAEPVKADPIDADPIDIAPIAVSAVQPPPIQIEPIIMEPISSSND